MDPYDTKISIDKILTQEKKWVDAVNTASVNVRDKDPVSASCIAWVISNGDRISDHDCQGGRLTLPDTWQKGDFYQATKHWEMLGLSTPVIITTPVIIIAP